ncbi:MAG TPA: hypothetical protein VLE93_02970 [Candidatus Saccharimonadales bacterium]|nr:hypothetical protein [Candidatus Saccharimonadales bacterium]
MSVIYFRVIAQAGTFSKVNLYLKYDEAPPPVCLGVEMQLPGSEEPLKVERMIQDGQTGNLTVLLEVRESNVAEEAKQPYLKAGWRELPHSYPPVEVGDLKEFEINGMAALLY